MSKIELYVPEAIACAFCETSTIAGQWCADDETWCCHKCWHPHGENIPHTADEPEGEIIFALLKRSASTRKWEYAGICYDDIKILEHRIEESLSCILTGRFYTKKDFKIIPVVDTTGCIDVAYFDAVQEEVDRINASESSRPKVNVLL